MTEDQVNEERPDSQGWSWKRWTLIGAAIVLIAAGAGTGAYFYGESTGEDLDAARAEGTAAGQKEGAAKGAEEGYAKGFEEGRKEGYEQTYDEAYRDAYQKAFEEADLEAPTRVKVPAQ